MIRALGREPRQRTTLYADAPAARRAASFGAAPLTEPVNTPARRWERHPEQRRAPIEPRPSIEVKAAPQQEMAACDDVKRVGNRADEQGLRRLFLMHVFCRAPMHFLFWR